jgi:hypothetical protein
VKADPLKLTEKQFMAQVIRLARLRGWLLYHPFDSRRSAAGYPDLTLVRGQRLIFAELKSEDGRLTPAQAAWLAALRAVPGVEVHIWHPAVWGTVEAVLR